MKTLEVSLGARSYPIYIGNELLTQAHLITPHIRSKQIVIVSNDTVAPLYANKLISSLQTANPDYQIAQVTLQDGEQFKTLETLNHIFDQLISERHNRTTTLIALGGGVVGDITGFAAACYQRGVDFIQIPTTLLSQVDSSVGGKTGVNHPGGKNMIGAFYQPKCVLADISSLKSLPARELAAGLAEVIKYGLIYDFDFFIWLENNIDALNNGDSEALIYAVKRSCEIKAEVVKADEHENGIRAILNFGHTFGHAIETEQGYGTWLHGEAVAVGMIMAADLSVRQGRLNTGELERIKKLITQAKLPSQPPADMKPEQFLDLMAIDKKVMDGKIRLILLKEMGTAFVTSDVDKNHLHQTLTASY